MLEFEMFPPRQMNSSGKSFRKTNPLLIPPLREIPWKQTEYVPLGTKQQLTYSPRWTSPWVGKLSPKSSVLLQLSYRPMGADLLYLCGKFDLPLCGATKLDFLK